MSFPLLAAAVAGAPMAMPAVPGAMAPLPVRTIPCAPPLDRPLRLTMTQTVWLADGSRATITAVRALRFARDPGHAGFLVEARLLRADNDRPDGGMRARMAAAYGPPGGPPMRIRLDPAMGIVAIDDLDGLWQAFRARQAALARSLTSAGKPDGRAIRIDQMLDAMSQADRLTTLTGFLTPALRYCGASAPAGTRPGPDGALLLDEAGDRPGLRDSSHYAVDASTGLLRRLDRVMTAAAQPLHPMRETWTLLPEN